MSRTRRPFSFIAAPNDATVVVLATPPFWLATANTRVTGLSKHARRRWNGWWGRIDRRGCPQASTAVGSARRNGVVALRATYEPHRIGPHRAWPRTGEGRRRNARAGAA